MPVRLELLRRLLPFALIASLAGLGGLAGCGGSPPPPLRVFPPLDYSYLPPITLNISNITFQNNYVPDPGAAALIGNDPQIPANVLMTMAQHRLVANGTPGNGTFTVENASLEPVGNTYVGVMTVRLDVVSLDGRKTGFTEASVSVTKTAPDSDATQNEVQGVLYDLTKALMDSMNVQLQYQIQQNMGSWISYGPNAATPALNTASPNNGGIQAAPLTAPGAPPPPGTPQPPAAAPTALTPGSLSLGTLPQ